MAEVIDLNLKDEGVSAHKLQRAIARLCAQKERLDSEDRERGLKEGRSKALNELSYKDLRLISSIDLDHAYEECAYQDLRQLLDRDRKLGSRFDTFYFTCDITEITDVFVRGYIEGVREFYHVVQLYLEDHF